MCFLSCIVSVVPLDIYNGCSQKVMPPIFISCYLQGKTYEHFRELHYNIADFQYSLHFVDSSSSPMNNSMYSCPVQLFSILFRHWWTVTRYLCSDAFTGCISILSMLSQLQKHAAVPLQCGRTSTAFEELSDPILRN